MKQSSNETRDRILKMSRNLLSVHGCEGTSLSDIITASGITKGAFYHYFKSKDSLCEAVIKQAVEDYHQLTESLDEGRPIERLTSMLNQLSGLNTSGQWVNCRLILRLMCESQESHPKIQKKLRDFWSWYESFFTELIEDCRQAGELSDRPGAARQGRLVIELLAGNVLLSRTGREQAQKGDFADTIINAIQF